MTDSDRPDRHQVRHSSGRRRSTSPSTRCRAGLTLYLDGIAKTTPFVYDTLVGFNHTIEARNQTLGSARRTRSRRGRTAARRRTRSSCRATNQSYIATFQVERGATGASAAYAFNEGTGTTAADASGNGLTGTLTNGAPGARDDTDAVQFDGVNDFVEPRESDRAAADRKHDCQRLGQLARPSRATTQRSSPSERLARSAISLTRRSIGGRGRSASNSRAARAAQCSGTARRRCRRTPGTTSPASTTRRSVKAPRLPQRPARRRYAGRHGHAPHSRTRLPM